MSSAYGINEKQFKEALTLVIPALTKKAVANKHFRKTFEYLMFKTTSMTKTKTKGLNEEQILQFSLAEFSSAIEMLQAAKLVKNQKLKIGFINHALDEYKHTNFFLNLLSKTETNRVRFDPRLIVSANFIKPEQFLFEKLSLVQFAAFISINEANALKIFTSVRDQVKKFDENSLIELDQIIEEEKEHLQSMKHNDQTKNGEVAENTYDMLLSDEAKHVEFSSKFLDKQPSKNYVKFIRFKSYVATRFRHLWASQQTPRNVIDRIISVLVVLMIFPLRAVIALPSKNNKNLYCHSSAENMI